MLYYRYHWDKIEIFEFEESPKNPQKLNQFSILISFRNEADQLEKLFNSIKKEAVLQPASCALPATLFIILSIA